MRLARVSGITQTLLSFADYIKHKKGEKIELLGVDVVGSQIDKARCNEDLGEHCKLITKAVEHPLLGDLLKELNSIKDVEKAYKPIIDSYAQTIEEQKPNVIIVNGTYYFPWCLLLAAKRYSIPIIVHYHGSITKETEGWPENARKIFRDMERQFDDKNFQYIFPSELTQQSVEEFFGHKIKNSIVLPSPIPEHFFEQKKASVSKRVIGAVSRWTKIKNPAFLRKLAHYNKRFKNSKYQLRVVTDLHKDSKLRENLSDVITFKKPVKNEDLASFYSKLGIIISPSHFETYGNVPQEALASGTPALVSKNMGVAETFEKVGLKSWVVDFSSVVDVYSKIEDVYGSAVTTETRDNLKELCGSESVYKKFNSLIKQSVS